MAQAEQGIFEALGIDMDNEVEEASGFAEFEDGYYQFETSLMDTLNGTSTAPDALKFIIDFDLYDDDGLPLGAKREFFTLFEGGEVTAKAEKSRTYLKRRFSDLGLSTNLNAFHLESGVGIRGTLQLATKDGWQNVRNVKIADADEEVVAEPVTKPAIRAKAAPAVGAKKNPFGTPKS
jgi:hypothetical protein